MKSCCENAYKVTSTAQLVRHTKTKQNKNKQTNKQTKQNKNKNKNKTLILGAHIQMKLQISKVSAITYTSPYQPT